MHKLDSNSQERLEKRCAVGAEILALAWGEGHELVDEDRPSAASDAISDVLTVIFGPAGVLIPNDPKADHGFRSHYYENGARELLDAALRSYEGDHEDYIAAVADGPEAQALASLARRAFDVLTSHDLDPSTRDLVTVEGLTAATWADGPGERVELLDVILAEYEAQAVAASKFRAVSAILAVRVDCRAAIDAEPERQPEPGEYGYEGPEPGAAIIDAIGRLQKMRDQAQAEIDENDKPGGWLDSSGAYKDWESEAAAREVEATRAAFDRVLDVLQTLAHGLTPAQGGA